MLGEAGQVILDTVYLQEVTIWNSGEQKVEPEDVRRPITIKSEQPLRPALSRILDLKIVARAAPNVTKGRLQSVEGSNGLELELSWQHLNEGHAVKFQYIDFGVVGTVEGVPRRTDALLLVAERFIPWFPRWLSYTFMGVVCVPALDSIRFVFGSLIVKQKTFVRKALIATTGLLVLFSFPNSLVDGFSYLFFIFTISQPSYISFNH